VGLRDARRLTRADSLDLGLRLTNRRAASQPPEDVDRRSAQRRVARGVDPQWRPRAVRDGERKPVRHHPHHFGDGVSDPHAAADDRCVAAEPALPHAVTDDEHRGRAGALVLFDEHASEQRTDPRVERRMR